MANAYSANTWKLDTAHTTQPLFGLTDEVQIKRMKWEPNAASDALVIKDLSGVVRINEVALAPTPSGDVVFDYTAKPLRIKGPLLHTMTSGGILYVELMD